MSITLLNFTLASEDNVLFALESLVVIAEVICISFAIRVGRRYPKLTRGGWREIVIGLVLAIFPAEMTAIVVAIGGGIYALFIPLLFWYLAYQSGGILRKSNFMLGLGFFVLFAGRVLHSGRVLLDSLGIISYAVTGVLAPGLIVIGLILIATGNEWGQTQ